MGSIKNMQSTRVEIEVSIMLSALKDLNLCVWGGGGGGVMNR